ncbi:hypothetical protein B0H10DRAFT_2108897 [Mycena sp. CBHHK59/15]|nr:hypothetical protein B0H10DRAFT_2108897 [Mycena sp. CBHHK59/15]
MGKRKKQKRDGEFVWPEDVEAALVQGLSLYPRKHKKVVRYVLKRTNIYRSTKQISSWVQTERGRPDSRLPDSYSSWPGRVSGLSHDTYSNDGSPPSSESSLHGNRTVSGRTSSSVRYHPYGSASGSRVSLASGDCAHLDPSGDLAGDGAGSGREIHRINGNVITFASPPIGQTSGNGHMAAFHVSHDERQPHISDVVAPTGIGTYKRRRISDLLHSLPTTYHHHLSRPRVPQQYLMMPSFGDDVTIPPSVGVHLGPADGPVPAASSDPSRDIRYDNPNAGETNGGIGRRTDFAAG